jgi:hypothetical protein
MAEFEPFPKIPRLNRSCVISEKIDGTNAQIIISEDGSIVAASRSRLITPEDDNFGFAKWVRDNADELIGLGVGRHFGEWWGAGIQRRYGQDRKRFSLFNAARWSEARPSCCDIVPVLYAGLFSTEAVEGCIRQLRESGSVAAPGFMNPEGVIVWHDAARVGFKVTLERDQEPKSIAREAA